MSRIPTKQQLFPNDIVRKLRTNGDATRRALGLGLTEPDHRPVLKVFNPLGPSTWLLSEMYEDNDTCFGLCDLGHGFPEIGCVSRAELESVSVRPTMNFIDATTGERVVGKPKDGLPLERDEDWTTDYPLTVWLEAAQREGRIVDDERSLAQAAAKLEREPQWRRRQEEQHV